MTKTDSFISTADRLAALAEPVRLRIVAALETAELSVGEVARVVQLPQSTISRHLKSLAEAGWVIRRAEGPSTFYCVAMDDLSPEARDIWSAVRVHAVDGAQLAEDSRRIAAVLAERRTDSVTFFGRLGGEWDQVRTQLFGSRFTAEAMLNLISRDWVIADVGCGTGNAAELLATRVAEVIAIDQSTAMLEAAQRRLESHAPNNSTNNSSNDPSIISSKVRFVLGGTETLPIADASVDAVTCVLVLHHVDEPWRALAEIRRVLRTFRGGGVALVVDMQRHTRDEYRRTMGHKHQGFDAPMIEAMATKAGLKLVHYEALAPEPESMGPGLFAARLEVL